MKVVETYLYKWLGRTWKPKYPEAWGLYEGANKICEICEQPISDDKLYCRWGLVVVNGFRKPHLFCGHRECLRKKKKRGGAKMGKAICKCQFLWTLHLGIGTESISTRLGLVQTGRECCM